MFLRQLFDRYLAQYSYLIGCQRSGEAIVIDPERDIDQYTALAAANDLRIVAVAETHIHADFVSGGQEFAADPKLQLYLSAEGGPDWLYRWPAERPHVHWLKANQHFFIGNIRFQAIHTPGHTPEHLSFLVQDEGGGADQPMALLTGDFLFVNDVGRPDLLESAAGHKGVMEPSARQLAGSLRDTLTAFEDYLQILPAHGAGSACGKALGAVPTTTLGYERRFNQPFRQALGNAEDFVRTILSGQPEPPPYFATMKKVNRDGIRVTGGLAVPRHLNAQELSVIIENDKPAILDSRADAAAFAQAHLPGAIHAPLHSPFFSVAAGSYLEAEQKSVVLCENETEAMLAARQLYRIGLDGLLGWTSPDEVHAHRTATLSHIDFTAFQPQQALQEGAIIDVRTAGEFALGHVDGAHSFPYTRLKERLAELPQERRLYIHCGSGKRAALASSYLQLKGFAVTYVDGVCEDCQRIAQMEGALA
ncbi:MAG: rhodanese-like domain-containing protein [Verrucomicrobiales bacterium]